MGNKQSAVKLKDEGPPELDDDEQNNDDNDPPTPRSDGLLIPPPDTTFYCFRRLCRELICCQPWFHAIEPVNQRDISIPDSFAPSTCTAFLLKCAFTGIAAGTFAYAFFESDEPEFVMALLTMWGNCCCVLYLLLSTLNTVFAERTGQAFPSAVLRIRTTWVLFELAAHISLLASVGFYATLVDWRYLGDLAYLDYILHGGVLILVLIDGLVINRIPFRFQHYFGILLPVELSHVLWTYIHSLITDGSIYGDALDWSKDWAGALILSMIMVFGIGPLLFVVLWSLSNGLFYCCRDIRRYTDDVDETDERPTVHDVEQGSVFGRWLPK